MDARDFDDDGMFSALVSDSHVVFDHVENGRLAANGIISVLGVVDISLDAVCRALRKFRCDIIDTDDQFLKLVLFDFTEAVSLQCCRAFFFFSKYTSCVS